jgi:segregation and condensation protein A
LCQLFAADPAAAAQADQDAARTLAQLRTLQQMQRAAAWLAARPQCGCDVFVRPSGPQDPRAASYLRLLEACLTLLQGRAEQAPAVLPGRTALPPLYRVPAAIARMRRLLRQADTSYPLAAFLPPLAVPACAAPVTLRSAVASTFMAALELSRARHATLTQKRPFDTIHVGPVPDAQIDQPRV